MTYFTFFKFNVFVLFLFLTICFSSFSQGIETIQSKNDSIAKNKEIKPNKKWLFPTLTATTYLGGMAFLYQSWYKNENQTSFHFFNDNKQWNQLDKFGHTYTSYQIGKVSYYTLKKLHYSEKTAIWASTAGFWLMLPIEIFDGFSPTYGASTGDLAANGIGSLLFVSQQIAFKQQKIQMKFSFFPTSYSDMRPNTLGENLPTKIIKDYNGQTYWFSSSPSLWKNKATKFPKWLALSVGYGANNMLYGSENQNNENGYQSARTFYLSLDINWNEIKTKHKGLKLLFGLFNGIKMPFPAFYFDTKKGFNGRWIAF